MCCLPVYPEKKMGLSGCWTVIFQKLFLGGFDGFGHRLEFGVLQCGDFPQSLAVSIQTKAALLNFGELAESDFDAFCPFCGIILDGIFIAFTILKSLIVDGIKRIAVVAVALLQRVFGFTAGGDYGTDLIGDIDFRNLAGGKLVLDYHLVPFPSERYRGTQKRACG